jgi:putative ABC transport system permease protein
MGTAIHLAFKELWRNKGRFVLFSLVVALITILVLFVAALGEGLGSGNREYLEKLNADLIAYQDTARLSIAGSRLGCQTRRAIRNVEGVREVGSVGFASAAIPLAGEPDPLDVSLIGVEPGMPGEPPVVTGSGLVRKGADEVIVDRTVAWATGVQVGAWLTVRTAQGSEDQFYELQVVGITDSRKYSIRPSIFVPLVTWDKIRPQAVVAGRPEDEPACNVAVVQLEDAGQIEAMRRVLAEQVGGIEVVDRQTAYENTPGYSEQQSTLATQNTFALLIGMLVIGGFFQIQTLQKVPQIGMLKAIGTSNAVVALSTIVQIILVISTGIVLGGLAALGLSLVFPPNIPIVFELRSALMAVASIFAIGPIGGLVSIRYSLRVEPLTALGLNS